MVDSRQDGTQEGWRKTCMLADADVGSESIEFKYVRHHVLVMVPVPRTEADGRRCRPLRGEWYRTEWHVHLKWRRMIHKMLGPYDEVLELSAAGDRAKDIRADLGEALVLACAASANIARCIAGNPIADFVCTCAACWAGMCLSEAQSPHARCI